jgi:hypothetical protein
MARRVPPLDMTAQEAWDKAAQEEWDRGYNTEDAERDGQYPTDEEDEDDDFDTELEMLQKGQM